MAHIFKPGDRAYWVKHRQWVTLKEFTHRDYPLKTEEGEGGFTLDGRFICGGDIVLLPLNPYDPTDPLNPPEFRSEWPFLLRGRRLEIGMEILVETESGIVPARIMTLQLSRSGVSVGARHTDGTSSVVWSPVILFPDELPIKKKVAKWAYPVIGMPGAIRIEFTDEMTQEEAEEKFGSFIQMIPGTEREVEA